MGIGRARYANHNVIIMKVKILRKTVYSFYTRLFVAVCAIFLIVMLLPVSSCAEEGYVEIGRNEIGVYSIYVPSVEDRGTYFCGWIKQAIRNGKKINGQTPDTEMTLLAANKERRQIQTLSYVIYDKKGGVLESNSFMFNTYQWQDVVPNSMGEAVWISIVAVGTQQHASKNEISYSIPTRRD